MKVNLEKILQNKLKSLDHQIKEEVISKNSSPNPMQSHSDKTRQVAEQMIDSLYQERKNLLVLKKSLIKFPKFNNTAQIGSIINLKSQIGEKVFLLVPEGLGGVIVNNIFLLSVGSPLAKKFLGKKIGYKFNFNSYSYNISSILPN